MRGKQIAGGDKILSLTYHGDDKAARIHPVVRALGVTYQKSQAFDLIKAHRAQLSDINKRLQVLAKSTAKGQGTVMSQLLGQKMQIEKTIELIFAGLK